MNIAGQEDAEWRKEYTDERFRRGPKEPAQFEPFDSAFADDDYDGLTDALIVPKPDVPVYDPADLIA